MTANTKISCKAKCNCQEIAADKSLNASIRNAEIGTAIMAPSASPCTQSMSAAQKRFPLSSSSFLFSLIRSSFLIAHPVTLPITTSSPRMRAKIRKGKYLGIFQLDRFCRPDLLPPFGCFSELADLRMLA